MRLTDPKSPYAVRAQCIKLAYVQMRYWPELLNELRQTLEMIASVPTKPLNDAQMRGSFSYLHKIYIANFLPLERIILMIN